MLFFSQLTNKDWEILPKVVELLSLIESSSKQAEKDDSVTSYIMPLTKLMFTKVGDVSKSLSSDLVDVKAEAFKNFRRLVLIIFFSIKV